MQHAVVLCFVVDGNPLSLEVIKRQFGRDGFSRLLVRIVRVEILVLFFVPVKTCDLAGFAIVLDDAEAVDA